MPCMSDNQLRHSTVRNTASINGTCRMYTHDIKYTRRKRARSIGFRVRNFYTRKESPMYLLESPKFRQNTKRRDGNTGQYLAERPLSLNPMQTQQTLYVVKQPAISVKIDSYISAKEPDLSVFESPKIVSHVSCIRHDSHMSCGVPGLTCKRHTRET